MGWLKQMGLKRSFFLLSVSSLMTALLLTVGVYLACERIADRYPKGGLAFLPDGTRQELEKPSEEQARMLELLYWIELFSAVVFPAGGLGAAGFLFYHLKLKEPIRILQAGTERIKNHDLDFSIPEVSDDELGQICAAFETMRAELLKTSRSLWRQAEERRRLNAAFSHNLRNPVTVLKGSVRLLQMDREDDAALNRLEVYTLRVEQYVEAMSSIQRLEQLAVRPVSVDCGALRAELEETARLLAPGLSVVISAPYEGRLQLDHGIFLTVAENLLGNAARFADRKVEAVLGLEENRAFLSVTDDGPGFPAGLLANGPKPFGKTEESGEHFGMGLYSSSLLCQKHGGELCLKNGPSGGAAASASFKVRYMKTD